MPSDKTTSGFDLSAGAGPSQRSEWPTLSQSSPVKNSTDRPSKQPRLMTSYFGGGSSSQGGASQEVRTTSYCLLLLLLTGPCPLLPASKGHYVTSFFYPLYSQTTSSFEQATPGNLHGLAEDRRHDRGGGCLPVTVRVVRRCQRHDLGTSPSRCVV
jgi:hypothetical protein